MDELVDPVVLFDGRGHMWWVGDPALAEEELESPDEVAAGFDGFGRPVRVKEDRAGLRLVVASREPQEKLCRMHVNMYYFKYARIQGLAPPNEILDIREFLYAVSAGHVEE